MKKLLLLVGLFCAALPMVKAQQSVAAANQFINLLDNSQKAETLFPFDIEERYNYHFVPIVRKGITFNEMNVEQRKAAIALIRSCLSEQTFQKTQQIMALDQVLKVLENRKPEDHYRDTGNYHICIFGTPAANTIWGWKFEGHHIAFNFSVDKQKLVSGTPGFLGSNPAVVLEGPQKGKQVLKDETEMGFALLHSLTNTQSQKAIVDTGAPKDIISFDSRSALLKDVKVGIGYAELTPVQQQLMLQLINLYIHRFTKLFADDMLKDIQKAGLNKLSFAWAGHTQSGIGNPHYYRILGPTLVIEYDNTQNNANHVHSVVRDLKNDFGGDELLEHYKSAHTN